MQGREPQHHTLKSLNTQKLFILTETQPPFIYFFLAYPKNMRRYVYYYSSLLKCGRTGNNLKNLLSDTGLTGTVVLLT